MRYVILSIHVVFEDNQNRLKRIFLVAKLYYGLTDAREIRLQTEYLTPCVVTCHKRSRSLVVWLRETLNVCERSASYQLPLLEDRKSAVYYAQPRERPQVGPRLGVGDCDKPSLQLADEMIWMDSFSKLYHAFGEPWRS